MTRDQLLELFDAKVAQAKALMSKKNQDYAEVDEVFGNLNVCEQLNIAPAESGILIRMTDKLRRLISLTKRDAAVLDESFDDTCLDLINYTVLLMARRSERTSKPSLKGYIDEKLEAVRKHGYPTPQTGSYMRAYTCGSCGKEFVDLTDKWVNQPPLPKCWYCRADKTQKTEQVAELPTRRTHV